ncbi:MAG: hypothetical protein IKM58_01545 [Tidjanibacter sp.]|nr:hypothetical protein [Tidjanibacter sp.]
MVDKIISEYLRTGRRLIVPELGVFIKREDRDDIVFSTLLTRNDGILLQMIQDRIRMSEEKAAIILHHYVSEVNSQLDAVGKFSIDGLGTLIKRGEDIDFIYSGDKNAEIIYRQRMAEFAAQQPAQQTKPVAPQPTPQQQTVAEERQKPVANKPVRRESADTTRIEKEVPSQIRPQKPIKQEQPAYRDDENIDADTTNTRTNKKDIFKNLMGLDAPIKKIQKTTLNATAKRRNNPNPNPLRSQEAKQGKKSFDIVLIAAVVAAIIALGVIIYGATAQHPDDDIILDQSIEQTIEQSTPETAGDAQTGVSAEASAAVHF